MKDFNVIEAFEKNQIILQGHFKLRSGKHSSMYISKDKLYTKPELLADVILLMGDQAPPSFSYEVVCGPAEAGIVLATAFGVGQSKPIVWSSKFKYGDLVYRMEIRDAFKEVVKDNRVLLVEDLITTGGSTEKTMQAVHEAGGEVVAVRSIWNRENWRPKTTASFKTLINRTVQSWETDVCPLCKEGIPLIDPKTGEIK